jgi:hypothetical protein
MIRSQGMWICDRNWQPKTFYWSTEDDNGQFVLISKSANSNKKSVDPTVRIFAIEDLAKSGFEASQDVPLLSTALDDTNSNIR